MLVVTIHFTKLFRFRMPIVTSCDLHSFTERLFEDHELLVDNLMNWSTDSKNRVLFLQRSDKIALFHTPEKFLNSSHMASGNDYDEHTRY